jgi:hypothetical protein
VAPENASDKYFHAPDFSRQVQKCIWCNKMVMWMMEVLLVLAEKQEKAKVKTQEMKKVERHQYVLQE